MNEGLIYQNTTIQQEGDFLNLTDMWRAAGGDSSKRPVEWLRSSAAKSFIQALSLMVGISHHELYRVKRGGPNTSTWAHWQLGMAYAQYLSPEFHVWCNNVVRAHMQGRSAPVGSSLTAEQIVALVAATVTQILEAVLPKLVGALIDAKLATALKDHDAGKTGLVGTRFAREISVGLKTIARMRAVAKGTAISSERGKAEAELRRHTEFYGAGCAWRNLPESKRERVMGGLIMMNRAASEQLRDSHIEAQQELFVTKH